MENHYRKRNIWSGFLFGLGLVAFLDEAVFHQILHWHHFYDRATTAIGLFSDGLFHAFSWLATVGALFMMADLRRRNAWQPETWIGGIFLGGGIFNFYDGIVQHKWMKLHQIRYNVDILPYDIVWNVLALLMIINGTILLFRSRRKGTGRVPEHP
jgi:uncharacterized membrane protein